MDTSTKPGRAFLVEKDSTCKDPVAAEGRFVRRISGAGARRGVPRPGEVRMPDRDPLMLTSSPS